ncbi:MAG: AbrB/MazE/SpoVT family DNA-binding domain-containing protein [Paracoccaceae bacterium]
MLQSTLTSKGQTTLPKPVRDALGLHPGDKICFLVVGDEVRILPVRKLASLGGLLQHDGSTVEIEDMDTAIYGAAAERARR